MNKGERCLTSIYAGSSSEERGGGFQSLDGLLRFSVTNHCSLGQPLKVITSPAGVRGKPL